MSSNGDAFGSLAALFTSGPAGGAPSPQSSSKDGPSLGAVTTVLVGNVPVMAGLWTTQLADEVAKSGGPTALVRFERDDVTLELLRADGRQVPPAGPAAVTRWLPRAATTIRRWLVCMPAETAPADVLAAGNEIVFLTGSDEAAVTGAYLRLKHLADEGIHGGAPLQRVGLVVVGATPEQAALAAARLGDAARSFLGVDVETIACLPRIERVESSARASYPSAECPGVAQFTRELERARSDASLRFDAEPVAAMPLPMSHATESAVEPKLPAPAAPVARIPAPAATSTEGHAMHTGHAGNTAHTPSHATPHAHPAAAHHAPARPAPAFAALPVATLPAKLVPLLRGLRPLGIACPVAPDVELALDDDRRMHIVGRSDQLARVRTARTWATMHRELLGLAFAELKDGFEVRERILLGDAREAISLHGTGCLLDVLVVADTPAGPVNVLVALNDPTTAG